MSEPDGSADRDPQGPVRDLKPMSPVALWPVFLVIALIGVSLFSVSAVTPSREVSTAAQPEEPPLGVDVDQVPATAVAIQAFLSLAGLAGLLLLLKKRVRRRFLPPPFLGPRVSWGLAELVQGILLVLAFLLAGGALAALVEDGVRQNIVLMAVQSGLVIALIALVARHAGAARGALEPEERSRAAMHELGLTAPRPQSDTFKGLAFGLIALPVAQSVAVVGVLVSHALGLKMPTHPVVQRVAGDAGAMELVLIFLAAVVVIPLVEEVAFRGFIYPTLRQRLGLWWGVALSSLLFGLLHPGLPSIMATFVLGAALCGLYERTGSLLAPVVAHGTFNLIQLSMTMLLRFSGADV